MRFYWPKDKYLYFRYKVIVINLFIMITLPFIIFRIPNEIVGAMIYVYLVLFAIGISNSISLYLIGESVFPRRVDKTKKGKGNTKKFVKEALVGSFIWTIIIFAGSFLIELFP